MEGYIVNVRQAADFRKVMREYELKYDDALKRARVGRSVSSRILDSRNSCKSGQSATSISWTSWEREARICATQCEITEARKEHYPPRYARNGFGVLIPMNLKRTREWG